MKKILSMIGIAMLAAGCTDDYTDWANPFKNDPEAAKTMTMSVSATSTIDFATVTAESVQAFVPNVTIDDEAQKSFTVVLQGENEGDEAEVTADENGYVETATLESAVYSLYGQRPVTRQIPIEVSGYITVGGQTFKGVGNTTLTCIPNAPEIEAAYYLTGTLNGWDNTDTTYKLTNDGSDPYENPTFTLRIPAPEDGSNVEFKMTPESGLGGDWGKCLAAGSADGKFNYNNDGGNLVITAVPDAVYYDLVFNMMDQTWTATALLINIEPAYYLTGTINGWNNSDTTYKMTNNGGDPYENPTFTLRIPAPEDGSNVEFKMTPESGLGGDWSKCLTAAANEGEFAYNNAGGNLTITAIEGAKYYDITFNMMDLTWSYTAVSFEQYVYFIGATDGWAASDQRVEAVSDGVYTGYVYIADPNGWGVEFKFQKRAGDWADDSQLNSNNMAEVTGDFEKTGDNFKASAGEGVYYVELDLTTNTLKGTLITNMNLVGDFNGWNPADDSQQMKWDAENFCYVITGAGVTASGWKFTTNNSWDVNLGGTIDKLVANGDNLSVVGTTIKLYPTRKGSDNIYATVE